MSPALVHAAGLGDRLELPERAAAGPGRPPDLRAARQAARRLKQPLHHDAHPRARARITTTGRTMAAPAGATTTCCPTSRRWKTRRMTRTPRPAHGGPIPLTNAGPAQTQPDLAGVHRRLPGAWLPAHRRLQRPEDGRRRLASHQRQGRQAAQHCAVGYLEPALKRTNLTLATDAQATRLLFDGTRCIGVEYVQNGDSRDRATPGHEVIVCAGAIESPNLLLQFRHR